MKIIPSVCLIPFSLPPYPQSIPFEHDARNQDNRWWEVIRYRKPAVVQNWMDPFHQDSEARETAGRLNITYQAYSSLGAQWIRVVNRARHHTTIAYQMYTRFFFSLYTHLFLVSRVLSREGLGKRGGVRVHLKMCTDVHEL